MKSRYSANEDVLKRIVELMELKGVSQRELCLYLGLDRSMFTGWKDQKGGSIMKYVNRIAELLDVKPYYLIAGQDVQNDFEIDSSERLLIMKLCSLPDEQEEIIRRMIMSV